MNIQFLTKSILIDYMIFQAISKSKNQFISTEKWENWLWNNWNGQDKRPPRPVIGWLERMSEINGDLICIWCDSYICVLLTYNKLKCLYIFFSFEILTTVY